MTKSRANRFGLATLLTFFHERARFPSGEVKAQGVVALSKQFDVRVSINDEAFLTGSTTERMRAEIRVFFGFRETTEAEADMLTVW